MEVKMVYALLVACIAFMAMQTFSLRYLKAENIRQNLLANGLFSALIAIAFVVFVVAKGMPISVPTVWFGALFGFGFIATVSVYYYAMQSGPLSYTTFFFSASMIVPVIIGLFVWDESLKLTQGIGMAMFMAAFYCISVLGGEKGGKVNIRWIILCFATWLLNGLIGVVSKQHQINMNGGEYVQMMMMSFVFATVFALIAAVFFAIVDSKREKKAVGTVVKTDMNLMWNGKIPLLGAALGSGMANVIMTYLSSRLPGGYLYPITLGSVVVLVSLFSILVLKEKPSKPGLVGILIGLVAIVVTNL